MNKKNVDIKFPLSLPLQEGDVQKTHELIVKYTNELKVEDLKFLSDYLDVKKHQALGMSYEDKNRDAGMLEDLGNLALTCADDVYQQIEDKNTK
jgi:hypothetical protein